MMASMDFSCFSSIGSVFGNFGERADLREHAHQLLDRAHLADLLQLIAKILEREFVLAELALHFARLFLVDVLLGSFDQAEHVAHAEDARDDAVGEERLERVVFFADADEFHGRAGDFADGKRRAAARVAIEFGEDHAGDAEALVKFAGGAHGVLPDHGVGDEQNFRGIELALEHGELVHQLVVNVQAAGGIDQNHVAGGKLCFADGAAHDFERLVGAGAGPDGSAGGFGDLRELFAGGGAIDVGGNDDGAVAVLGEPFAELAGGGGFAGALQAADQPDRRRARRKLRAASRPRSSASSSRTILTTC